MKKYDRYRILAVNGNTEPRGLELMPLANSRALGHQQSKHPKRNQEVAIIKNKETLPLRVCPADVGCKGRSSVRHSVTTGYE
jgi:hypothetical protein